MELVGFFKHELEISFYLEWQTSTTSHLSVSFPKTSLTLCWKSKSAAAEMLLARDRGPYWLLFSWVCPGWDRFNSAPTQQGFVPTQPANARPARNTLHSQLISPRQLQIQMKIQLQIQIQIQIQMIIQIQILNQLYLQDNCVRVNILSHITYICI